MCRFNGEDARALALGVSARNLRKIYVRLAQAVSQGHNMSGPRMNHAVIVDLIRDKFNLSY